MPVIHDSNADRPPGIEFAFAALSGVGAGCFTNPVDVIKIRMQLQGELIRGPYPKVYRNTLHAFYIIARTEGVLALQLGLMPALVFQVFLNGTRLGTYHWAKRYGIILNEKGETSIGKTALVSGFAGITGAVIGSPFYLVKTQLQSQSTKSGMIPAFRHLWRMHGFFGLYRGWYANLPKTFIGSATQLTVFGIVTDWLKPYDAFKDKPLLLTFVGSLISGCCLGVVMQPFDVISTRLYNQGTDVKGKGVNYNGLFDALYKVFTVEGFFGLYKGITPTLFRSAPHVVLCQVFYENLSQLYDQIYATA
ncbi:solute carrier family 25 member 35-like [Copidosoma floridanum]|uniref:solute carrier family 25 member 35-like n=1 Tax=Copidosoma floridanum TaxID=29053 RepID=UPI0006C9B0A2|nr:solute carrier family 25 member 35-like [Copidosoma floridanum]XP_014211323.1 solute carrier family 25 member 35-like [Copidosoma floridanum]